MESSTTIPELLNSPPIGQLKCYVTLHVNYTMLFHICQKLYFILKTEFHISTFEDVSQIKRTAINFTLNSITALEVTSVRTYGQPLLLECFFV